MRRGEEDPWTSWNDIKGQEAGKEKEEVVVVNRCHPSSRSFVRQEIALCWEFMVEDCPRKPIIGCWSADSTAVCLTSEASCCCCSCCWDFFYVAVVVAVAVVVSCGNSFSSNSSSICCFK